jgi:acyl carrier protein
MSMHDAHEEVMEWLRSEGILELPANFSADGDLFLAGLDSMAVMQLVVAAEERFGVLLGPADLKRANLVSIRALAGLLTARSGA